MKYKLPLVILTMSTVLMTGCFAKTITKEKFDEAMVTVKQNIENVTNVHIKDKIQHTYDYKEGEFYRYNQFALLLVVPIAETECTWVEDGKYYHFYSNSTDSKKNENKEITAEEFSVYMLKHKVEIQTVLNRPFEEMKLFDGSNPDYSEITNSYKYSSLEKSYSLTTKAKFKVTLYEDGQDKTEYKDVKETYEFKKNLPSKWTKKLDGDSTWKYTYGKAEFKNPNDNKE